MRPARAGLASGSAPKLKVKCGKPLSMAIGMRGSGVAGAGRRAAKDLTSCTKIRGFFDVGWEGSLSIGGGRLAKVTERVAGVWLGGVDSGVVKGNDCVAGVVPPEDGVGSAVGSLCRGCGLCAKRCL